MGQCGQRHKECLPAHANHIVPNLASRQYSVEQIHRAETSFSDENEINVRISLLVRHKVKPPGDQRVPQLIITEGYTVTDPLSPIDISQLARNYGSQVYRAAYRLLGDRSQAEDVQQDVFLRLLEIKPTDVASWPAYLTASAVRVAIDRMRRQRRWRQLIPFWQASETDSAPSPEHHLAQLQRNKSLRIALTRLKPREAECFVMRHLIGMDLSAIAKAQGISENYVSVNLNRAVIALESRLREHGDNAKENKP